jgi:hypothetical protein
LAHIFSNIAIRLRLAAFPNIWGEAMTGRAARADAIPPNHSKTAISLFWHASCSAFRIQTGPVARSVKQEPDDA